MNTNNKMFDDAEKVGNRIMAVTDFIHGYGIPYHIIFMLLSDICYLSEIANHEENTSDESCLEDEDLDDLYETVDDIYPIYENEDYDDPYSDCGFDEHDSDDN